MEIALTPTPLATDPPIMHNITEHLAGECGRYWTAIAYANEDLQFTKHITKPATFEAPTDITLRKMITFQQEDRDQQIHQFLG